MKSKNPVNFQGIIDRKLQKTKPKPNDVTGVANNYSSIQQTKQENKQTKHTYNNITP